MIWLHLRHHKQLCSHCGKGGWGRSEQAVCWMGKSEATAAWENGVGNHSQGYLLCLLLTTSPCQLEKLSVVWKGPQATGKRLFRHTCSAEGAVLETAKGNTLRILAAIMTFPIHCIQVCFVTSLTLKCSSWRWTGQTGLSPSNPLDWQVYVQTSFWNACSSALWVTVIFR